MARTKSKLAGGKGRHAHTPGPGTPDVMGGPSNAAPGHGKHHGSGRKHPRGKTPRKRG